MPLSSFAAKLQSILPQWLSGQTTPTGDPLGGYQVGDAMTRLGHNPVMLLPDEEYKRADERLEGGGNYANTTFNASHLETLMQQLLGNKNEARILASSAESPTVWGPRGWMEQNLYDRIGGTTNFQTGDPVPNTLRHEAIHAFLAPVSEKMPQDKINSMIPKSGYNKLARVGYDPFATSMEIPARATTEPSSLNLSQGAGNDVMRKYIEMLRTVDPSRATHLAKYLGLSGSEKGDTATSFQRPNDTF